MFCSQGGSKMDDNAKFCPVCGKQVIRPGDNPDGNDQNSCSDSNMHYEYTGSQNSNAILRNENGKGAIKQDQQRCLPAFIIGLIGSIMGMFGGLCMSMCDVATGGNAPFLLIFGGSVVGLIGACLCMSKAKIGSILELIGSVMIIICAYGITGAEFMSVFAMVLLLVGGLIGVVDSFFIKHK